MQNNSIYSAYDKYLALQCQIQNVKHALKMSTLKAHTSIWITILNLQIHITTLKINFKYAEVTHQNLEMTEVSDRVIIILDLTLKTLLKLQTEIKSENRSWFSFMFIDADKENNWVYFNFTVNMTLSEEFIFVNNVMWRDDVMNEKMQKIKFMQEVMKVIEETDRNQHMNAVVMQTIKKKNYDDFLMTVIK